MSTGSIGFNNKIIEAYETSHVETDVKSISFSGVNFNTNISEQGLSTYRIKFSPSPKLGIR